MKTIHIIILLFISSIAFGQKSKTETVKIYTSIQCGMCEKRVGEALIFEKGVKSFDIDLNTKYVTVEYKLNKTNADNIKTAISKVGYDADDIVANAEAYEKLPACCKKPEDPNYQEHQD